MKGFAATRGGKGAIIIGIVGLILLTAGIVCAALGDDDDDEGLLAAGAGIGISFGVLCLVTGGLFYFCKDFCCCCMRPIPQENSIPSHTVNSLQQQKQANGQQLMNQPFQQPIHQPLQQYQQYANAHPPVNQPIQQQFYPHQPYPPQNNPAFVGYPPPYEGHSPLSGIHQQSPPLGTNEHGSYPDRPVRNDDQTTMGTMGTVGTMGTDDCSIYPMKQAGLRDTYHPQAIFQGHINPVFPGPQGTIYPPMAEAPSAPTMEINPPPYAP